MKPINTPVGDHCLGFFKELYEAGRIPIKEHALILEVGCAEADWLTPFKEARPDCYLIGMDQRKLDGRHHNGSPIIRAGADALVWADVMDASLWPPHIFDVIVAISVIEHVGIGRYGDPIDADGDVKAMANIHRWLKPDGVFYMDVPYRHEGPSTPFRQYNEKDLQARVIHGWSEVDRQHFDHVNHPDAPYVALVLRP